MQELGDLFVTSRGHPFHHFDVFRAQPFQSWIGFRFVGFDATMVPNVGHADASEAIRSLARFAHIIIAKQLPEREHGLGQPFANDRSPSFRVQPIVGMARISADVLEIVAFVAKVSCGDVPTRPFGAEFRSAGKHGLHFGGDCEHGNTSGKCSEKCLSFQCATTVFGSSRRDCDWPAKPQAASIRTSTFSSRGEPVMSYNQFLNTSKLCLGARVGDECRVSVL
jgi:hypothetical protein